MSYANYLDYFINAEKLCRLDMKNENNVKNAKKTFKDLKNTERKIVKLILQRKDIDFQDIVDGKECPSIATEFLRFVFWAYKIRKVEINGKCNGGKSSNFVKVVDAVTKNSTFTSAEAFLKYVKLPDFKPEDFKKSIISDKVWKKIKKQISIETDDFAHFLDTCVDSCISRLGAEENAKKKELKAMTDYLLKILEPLKINKGKISYKSKDGTFGGHLNLTYDYLQKHKWLGQTFNLDVSDFEHIIEGEDRHKKRENLLGKIAKIDEKKPITKQLGAFELEELGVKLTVDFSNKVEFEKCVLKIFHFNKLNDIEKANFIKFQEYIVDLARSKYDKIEKYKEKLKLPVDIEEYKEKLVLTLKAKARALLDDLGKAKETKAKETKEK